MRRLGVIAAVAFVLGPVLAWLRVIPALAGFAIFALGGLLALIAAIGALVRGVRGRGFGVGGVAALVVALVFVLIASRGGGVPRINDFTTDPADPPAFEHAQAIRANVGRDMRYPAGNAAIQQSCCGDLHPARLSVPPAEAFGRARTAAERMPSWTVTQADPGTGTIEAVATTRVFGFQDDIVIRVRPDGDGASRVDMRSKSRDGQGDIGTNAARIRAFVGRLEHPDGAPAS